LREKRGSREKMQVGRVRTRKLMMKMRRVTKMMERDIFLKQKCMLS
jgi:hypothetical protein